MSEQSADVLTALGEWCAADGVALVTDESMTWATAHCDGVDLEFDATGEGLVIRHRFGIAAGVFTWTIPGVQAVATPTVADVVARVIDSRWGPLRGETATTADGSTVTLECPIDVDELYRGAFRTAMSEVIKTRRVIDRMVADDAAQRAAVAAVMKTNGPAAVQQPSPAPIDGNAGGAGERLPRYTLVGPSAQATVGWTPTHVIPPGGTATWSAPSPDAASTARLDAGLRVRVEEQRGAWARIVCENGWTAWADGRLLTPLS